MEADSLTAIVAQVHVGDARGVIGIEVDMLDGGPRESIAAGNVKRGDNVGVIREYVHFRGKVHENSVDRPSAGIELGKGE